MPFFEKGRDLAHFSKNFNVFQGTYLGKYSFFFIPLQGTYLVKFSGRVLKWSLKGLLEESFLEYFIFISPNISFPLLFK